MHQKNRQQKTLRFQIRKLWDDINPGGNPENKRTEQKIDGQNVHWLLLAARLCPSEGVQRNRRNGASTHMEGKPVYQELPKFRPGIYLMAYRRRFDVSSAVVSRPMRSWPVQNRRVISRSKASVTECHLTAELSRALVCCSIAKWKEDKLPYLIIAERTSAKFIKLHAQGEIVESESILKLMMLLEVALGGNANVLSSGKSPDLRNSSSKSRESQLARRPARDSIW
jgi:hypothetical protein